MKNKYEILGEVTLIYAKSKDGRIEFTKIDTTDLEKVMKHPNKWHVYYDKRTKKYYVRSARYGKTILLHRLVMDEPRGLVVDHKNHDGMDNRKSNLKSVTIQENGQNRKGASRVSNSGVRGVSWNKNSKKWLVYLSVNKKRKYLGGFESLEEAEEHAKRNMEMIYYSPNERAE